MQRRSPAFATGFAMLLATLLTTLLATLASSRAPAQGQLPPDDIHLKLERTLTFVDGNDQAVSTDAASAYKGRWLLVYVGYMHCADLCPWGMTVLASALDMLGPAARHIQPLFITVDPERDRGTALIEFTRSFHGDIIGLTGTQAEIRAAADAMAVKFSRVQQGADYSVDHSSSYSLIDPERRRVVTFRKAEAHLVAAKVVEVLSKAGVKFDGMPGVGAWR